MLDIFTRIIKGDMNNPFVRQAVEWFARIANQSHFDPDVLLYPNTTLVQAFDKHTQKPILYIPVHSVFMLESLGPNPEVGPEVIAQALAQVTKTAAWEAMKAGMGEIYMPCSDGNVIQFAEKHGYFRQTYNHVETIPPKAAEVSAENQDAKSTPAQSVQELRDLPFLKMKVFK